MRNRFPEKEPKMAKEPESRFFWNQKLHSSRQQSSGAVHERGWFFHLEEIELLYSREACY